VICACPVDPFHFGLQRLVHDTEVDVSKKGTVMLACRASFFLPVLPGTKNDALAQACGSRRARPRSSAAGHDYCGVVSTISTLCIMHQALKFGMGSIARRAEAWYFQNTLSEMTSALLRASAISTFHSTIYSCPGISTRPGLLHYAA
jgi:hypothetical protein